MHCGACFFIERRRFSDPEIDGPIEIAMLLVEGCVENDVTISVEKLRDGRNGACTIGIGGRAPK